MCSGDWRPCLDGAIISGCDSSSRNDSYRNGNYAVHRDEGDTESCGRVAVAEVATLRVRGTMQATHRIV